MIVDVIALMMAHGDTDIQASTLALNRHAFDALYVLVHDRADLHGLPDDAVVMFEHETGYHGQPRDGWRQAIYQRAVHDHGYDNWFLILHADEVWRFNPRDLPGGRWPADGFIFRLPFYVPMEPWNDKMGPVEQLHWRLGPGWPEFRMFKGSAGVRFDPDQHFDTKPRGLQRVVESDGLIEHYPYRSPVSQQAKKRQHDRTGFDPDNYRHITPDAGTIWTQAMVEDAFARSHGNYTYLEDTDA